jgi:hypothetical protein
MSGKAVVEIAAVEISVNDLLGVWRQNPYYLAFV